MTLITGTTVAQALLILIAPILARLYTEDNFGVLTLYMSITTILSTIVTGRYELAIMLPKKEKEAINLTMLSIIISLIISVFVFIILLFFNQFFTTLLKTPEISVWLWFIPLNVALIAVYQSLYYLSNRKKYYKTMAVSRITKNTGVAGIGIIGGVAKTGNAGLILSRLIGDFISVISILTTIFKKDRNKIKNLSVKKMKQVAIKYKKFPTFLIFSHSIGKINSEIPTFIIKAFYSLGMLGQYSWAYRLIEMPTAIISRNMGDVFRQQATDNYHAKGEFKQIFVKTVKNLFLVAIIPLIIFWFIAPYLFSFILGEEWQLAGYFARILSIATFFSFVITPIDKSALIVGNTKYIFFWHILRFILNIASFFIIKRFNLEIEKYFTMLVIINIIMYLIELFVCYRFSLGYTKIFKNK